MLIFLCLPNGGLALLDLNNRLAFEDIAEVALNDILMEDSGLSLRQGSRNNDYNTVRARIVLPPVKMRLPERRVDCDTVLDFLTRMQPWEDTWSSVGAAEESENKQLEEYFSASNFLAILERVQQGQLGWSLFEMRLTEEMWRCLSVFEFRIFVAVGMSVPRSFWRETRAKKFLTSETAIKIHLSKKSSLHCQDCSLARLRSIASYSS